MNTMEQKKTFITPAVLQALSLHGETPILTGSVAEQTTVTATGQEVQEYDFSDESPFNHEWGSNL